MKSDSRRLVRPATTLLVPVVGVALFDWRLRLVLVFYWLEIGATVVRQTVEATFAGRPNSEDGRMFVPVFRRLRAKRGGVSTPGPLPPVHPRTAPAVVVGGSVSLALWVFAGTQIVALGGRVDLSAPPLEILLGTPVDTPAVLLGFLFGVAGVVVGQLSTFASNLQTRPYRDLSPRAIVGPIQILVPTSFLLIFVTGLFVTDGDLAAANGLVFALAVGGRTLVDVVDELGVFDQYVPDRLHPDTQVGTRESIRLGDGEPQTVWTGDRSSILSARILTSPGRVFPTRAGLLVGLIALILWSGLDGAAKVLAPAGVFVTVAVFGAVLIGVETDLLYGHLEYRLYDDCLVAYDRLLEAPQWRVELDDVSEIEVAPPYSDALSTFTLGRVYVRTRDDTPQQKLVGLADAEAGRARIDEARFDYAGHDETVTTQQ